MKCRKPGIELINGCSWACFWDILISSLGPLSSCLHYIAFRMHVEGLKRMHFCFVLTYFYVYCEDFLMLVSAHLCGALAGLG